MNINIKKLNNEAILPSQAKIHDAGYDLFALESYVLLPHERKLFKTGLAVAIPEGYYGRIAPRSGLALKNGIDVLGGVIDSTYRGDIGVILYNTNEGDETNSIFIEKGQRIAQLIIEKCHTVEWNEVEELDKTDRSEGGFGSTGN